MFDKLDFIEDKYKELAAKCADPEVIANQPVWQKHAKEMGEMSRSSKNMTNIKKSKRTSGARKK